jgi:hypothetical protein
MTSPSSCSAASAARAAGVFLTSVPIDAAAARQELEHPRRAPRSASIRASPASVMRACRSLSIHARGGMAVAIASPMPHA